MENQLNTVNDIKSNVTIQKTSKTSSKKLVKVKETKRVTAISQIVSENSIEEKCGLRKMISGNLDENLKDETENMERNEMISQESNLNVLNEYKNENIAEKNTGIMERITEISNGENNHNYLNVVREEAEINELGSDNSREIYQEIKTEIKINFVSQENNNKSGDSKKCNNDNNNENTTNNKSNEPTPKSKLAFSQFCPNLEDINKLNEYGWTPLYRTVVADDLYATKVLLTKGADPNIQCSMGETPLYQAVDMGKIEHVKLLLESNADPNIFQCDSISPLHIAVKKNYVDIVKLLLKHKANPNKSEKLYGQTPVHWAIKENVDPMILLLLVRYNGSLMKKDKLGKKTLDYVKSEEMKKVIEKLKIENSHLFKSQIVSQFSTPNKSKQFTINKVMSRTIFSQSNKHLDLNGNTILRDPGYSRILFLDTMKKNMSTVKKDLFSAVSSKMTEKISKKQFTRNGTINNIKLFGTYNNSRHSKESSDRSDSRTFNKNSVCDSEKYSVVNKLTESNKNCIPTGRVSNITIISESKEINNNTNNECNKNNNIISKNNNVIYISNKDVNKDENNKNDIKEKECISNYNSNNTNNNLEIQNNVNNYSIKNENSSPSTILVSRQISISFKENKDDNSSNFLSENLENFSSNNTNKTQNNNKLNNNLNVNSNIRNSKVSINESNKINNNITFSYNISNSNKANSNMNASKYEMVESFSQIIKKELRNSNASNNKNTKAISLYVKPILSQKTDKKTTKKKTKAYCSSTKKVSKDNIKKYEYLIKKKKIINSINDDNKENININNCVSQSNLQYIVNNNKKNSRNEKELTKTTMSTSSLNILGRNKQNNINNIYKKIQNTEKSDKNNLKNSLKSSIKSSLKSSIKSSLKSSLKSSISSKNSDLKKSTTYVFFNNRRRSCSNKRTVCTSTFTNRNYINYAKTNLTNLNNYQNNRRNNNEINEFSTINNVNSYTYNNDNLFSINQSTTTKKIIPKKRKYKKLSCDNMIIKGMNNIGYFSNSDDIVNDDEKIAYSNRNYKSISNRMSFGTPKYQYAKIYPNNNSYCNSNDINNNYSEKIGYNKKYNLLECNSNNNNYVIPNNNKCTINTNSYNGHTSKKHSTISYQKTTNTMDNTCVSSEAFNTNKMSADNIYEYDNKSSYRETFNIFQVPNNPNVNDYAELREWLSEIDLQQYTPLFVQKGIYSMKPIIQNLISGKFTLTRNDLSVIGLKIPGHIYRIITKVELDSGLIKRNIFNFINSFVYNKNENNEKNNDYLESSYYNFCGCCSFREVRMKNYKKKNYYSYREHNPCVILNNFSEKGNKSPTKSFEISKWLSNIDLYEYKNNFEKAGFEYFEYFMLQMFSSYPINDNILESDIKINNSFHREKIIMQLNKDVKFILNNLNNGPNNNKENKYRIREVELSETENKKEICNIF